MEKIKAVCLLSGGLDSAISTKMILDQGIECVALNFTSPFCTCNHGGKCFSKEQAEAFNIPYFVKPKGEEFLEAIRDPRYGYGQGINPCIDCKIFILKKAKQFMSEINAHFVITGEVLGQRPMSQHKRALRIIEKESGLTGLILRPLSANVLEETIPEKKGWVDRKKLLSIEGRSRNKQLDLAVNFNLETYSCAGGGCLLTEKNFALKLKDLFDYKDKVTYKDISLLKIGRHFRYNDSKIIVGRNEEENKALLMLKDNEELFFEASNVMGPVTLLTRDISFDSIRMAAQLTACYADSDERYVEVRYGSKELGNKIDVEMLTKIEANKYNLSFMKFSSNFKKIVQTV